MPWKIFWIIILILISALLFGAYKVRRWHHVTHALHTEKKLPEGVLFQLDELKKYKEKYGAKMLVVLLLIGLSFALVPSARAYTFEFTPPLITTISKDISNKDIFYLGGKTDIINETVIIYLQNLRTGETISATTESDRNGDWFYRHGGFLAPGDYLLWTQSQQGEQLSPPSSQIQMRVNRTAIEFGSNRLNYETIYFVLVILLLIILSGLSAFIIYHYYHGKRKHKAFTREVREAEESIRRGFALIRRDIERELEAVRKSSGAEGMSPEEKTI